MRPADLGGEKLELDALCGAELSDEDLDGVTEAPSRTSFNKTRWSRRTGRRRNSSSSCELM